MKILITGGSGFAGSHLIEHLVSRGAGEIYATTFNNTGYIGTILSADHILKVNLTDNEQVRQMISQVKPDLIYHLAALSFVAQSFDRAEDVMSNNMTLQIRVLNAVKEFCPNGRILVVGSAEEYGLSEKNELPIAEDHPFRPINPYAVSKVSQDLLAYAYAVSYKLNVLRVRPFNHIGERQTDDFAVPSFVKQIIEIEQGKKSELLVGNLTGIRDFTDVKDMVKAYVMVMEKGTIGEVYNIGSGKGVTMQHVVDTLSSFATVPISVKTDAARMRPLDIQEMVADTKKIAALGWKTEIELEETLKRTLDWMRKSIYV